MEACCLLGFPGGLELWVPMLSPGGAAFPGLTAPGNSSPHPEHTAGSKPLRCHLELTPAVGVQQSGHSHRQPLGLSDLSRCSLAGWFFTVSSDLDGAPGIQPWPWPLGLRKVCLVPQRRTGVLHLGFSPILK